MSAMTPDEADALEGAFGHAAAWAVIARDLAALPAYGVDLAAVGRALEDIPARWLLAVSRAILADPSVDRVPSPGVFRLRLAELAFGPVPAWPEVFGVCCAWARWNAGPHDDTPRPDLPDGAAQVMADMGVDSFRNPDSTLRAQFRDAWAQRATAALRERVAPDALAPAIRQLADTPQALGR